MSLRQAAVKGAFWSALATIFSRGFRFFITILLARILVPEDFGLIAMAMLIMDIAELLKDLGLGAALIQRKQLDPEHLTTCFWSNMAIGVFLWAATTALAPFAADFYRNESVGPVIRTLAFNFLIAPIGSVPWVLLTRELRFKEIMIAQSAATAVRGCTSLVYALLGGGVWSLVWGPIAGNVIGAVINWFYCKWRPSFGWSNKHFMDLFRFGRNVFGEKLLGYFSANTDFLVTGRFLGAATLGYYNFAYQLPHLAETHIVPIVGRVLFPVLSQVQDDRERMRRGYLESLRWIAVVCAPFAVGLFVTSPEFIPTVYGEKWEPVVVPLKILCAAGFVHALSNTVWTVQQALGRSDIGLWWNAVTLPFIIAALVLSARWGMNGIAATMLLVSVVLSGAIQHLTNRLIGLSWKRWFIVVVPPVAAALGMGVFAEAVRRSFLSLGWPALWVLLGTAALSAAAYTGLLMLCDRSALSDLKTLVRHPAKAAPIPAFEGPAKVVP